MRCINSLCQRKIENTEHGFCPYCGSSIIKINPFKLPDSLKGKTFKSNIIPTVCNVKNIINKRITIEGDYTQLKQWEKRSYKNYNIDKIKAELLKLDEEEDRTPLLRKHILSSSFNELGAIL